LTNLTSNNPKQSEPEGSNAHMAGITSPSTTLYNTSAICCLCKLDSDAWALDSGASHHMTYDKNTLYDLSPLDAPVLVSLPNGFKVHVTHHGRLRISDDLHLNHILLVPYFRYNLLSMKRLAS